MDFSILYTIGIVIFVVLFTLGINFLKRKNIIQSEDLLFTIKTLDLTLRIVEDLKLNKETEIKRITKIVLESIKFMALKFKDQDVDLIAESIDYAEKLCRYYGVELTDNRRDILVELIKIGVEKVDID